MREAHATRFAGCRRISIFLILLFLIPASTHASETPQTPAPETAPVLKAVVYPVAPFFLRDESGRWRGLEYDILTSFAESEGKKLEIVEVGGFQAVFEALARGEGDLGSAALTITPERLQYNDFSRPYFPVTTILIQPKGQEAERLEDLQGRRIALIDTTVNVAYVDRLNGVERVYVHTPEELLAAVADGRADACATDSSIFFWQAEGYPNLVPTVTLSERSFYGFLLPKRSALKPAIDAHLKKLQDGGEMQMYLRRAYGKWEPMIVDELTKGMLEGSRR